MSVKWVNIFLSNNYIEYKSKGDRNKTLSVEGYLDKTRPYLKIIIDLKKSDTWKIQLTVKINFISSKNDNDDTCVILLKNDNIEIMINDEADEVIKSKKGSELVFDYVCLLYINVLKQIWTVVDHI